MNVVGEMTFKKTKYQKVRRFLYWTMSILLFLLLSIFLVLQVDVVQTWLGRAATAYLSSELDTEISIERVSFRLVKSVVLKGVLIKDLHGDTLVHTSEINVSISKFSTKDHNLTVSNLLLSTGTFNLNRYKVDP
jgi:uncharacterized membrane protein